MTHFYSEDESMQTLFEVVEFGLINVFNVEQEEARRVIHEHYEAHAHHREEDRHYMYSGPRDILFEIYYENILHREYGDLEYWPWAKEKGFDHLPEIFESYLRSRYAFLRGGEE